MGSSADIVLHGEHNSHLPKLSEKTTSDELRLVIAQHPGEIIPGLGQLPKAELLARPERAYAAPEGTPDPKDIRAGRTLFEKAELPYREYGSLANRLIFAKAGFLWQERENGHITGTDEDIRMAVGLNLKTILHEMPQSIEPYMHALQKTQKTNHEIFEQEFKQNREQQRDAIRKYVPEFSTLEYQEMIDFLKSPAASSIPEEENKAIQEAILDKKRNEEFTRNYKIRDEWEIHSGDAQKVIQETEQTLLQESPNSPRAQKIAKRDAAIIAMHMMKGFSKGADEVMGHWLNITLAPINISLKTLSKSDIPKAVALLFEKNPEPDRGYTNLTPWLKQIYTQAFKESIKLPGDERNTDDIKTDIQKLLMNSPVPYEAIARSISDEIPPKYAYLLSDSVQFTPEATHMTQILADTVVEEPHNFDSPELVASLIILGHINDMDANRIAEARTFMENHRLPSYSRRQYVILNQEVVENARHQLNHNLSWANPALPSNEALQELRARQNIPKIEVIPPELQPYWNIVQSMAQKEGITPREWYAWALATKTPFLTGLAHSHRKGSLGEILHGLKIDGTESWQQDEVRRFPTKQEQFSVLSNTYTCRESGYRAWRIGPVPFRAIREYGLTSKDTYSPQEVLELYRLSYAAMRADYLRDDAPDSGASSLHYSLYCVLGSSYNQAYKSYGPDISHGNQFFDELDALLFLPAIAEENKNNPAIFGIGLRLYFQTDDTLKRQYAKEIAATFEQLAQQIPEIRSLLFHAETSNLPSLVDTQATPHTAWESPVPGLRGLTLNIADTSAAQQSNIEHALARIDPEQPHEFRYETKRRLVILYKRAPEIWDYLRKGPPIEDIRSGAMKVIDPETLKRHKIS